MYQMTPQPAKKGSRVFGCLKTMLIAFGALSSLFVIIVLIGVIRGDTEDSPTETNSRIILVPTYTPSEPTATATTAAPPTATKTPRPTPTPDCSQELRDYKSEMHPLFLKWQAMVNVAVDVPSSIATQIENIQLIRKQAFDIRATSCTFDVQSLFLEALDESIEGFTGVQNGIPAEESDLHFHIAIDAMTRMITMLP